MTEPRIALIDIETAPNLGWIWGKWEQNVIDFKNEWYLLSFAVKWLGEKSVKTYALPDFSGYKKNKENDFELAMKLWSVLDEADIVIAHNGDAFDIPKANARFVVHGFNPPAPYKTIDTLKIARKYFAFNSNKLDDLGRELGVGRKLHHTGFALWQGCMTGDTKAWKTMRAYNAHDIELLEQVYLRLRQWNQSRPSMNVYTEINGCPTCGYEKVQKRGFGFSTVGKKQRYQCKKCFAWSVGPITKIEGLTIR